AVVKEMAIIMCGRPPLPDTIDQTGIQRVYEPGAEVFLACKRGYVPSAGSRKIICTSNGKWTNPTLKCEREWMNPTPKCELILFEYRYKYCQVFYFSGLL
ncbi:hypothetical protein Z043_102092, partial [Scleropages formosus]